MREIKFRAWDVKNKEMLEDYPAPDDYVDINNIFYSWADEYVPMQFTGLKDKNSKEIYEGDILADIYRVEWDEGGMKYILTWTQDGYYSMELNELTWEDTVVIGNIYENPELIKSGQIT
jgi:hypothetical protein